LALVFFLLILPYISPRFKGLLNNFITPILPGMSKALYSESELLKENEELRKELQAYEAKQNHLYTLFEENKRLRKLHGVGPITKYEAVVATVTVKNPLTGKYRFIINRGLDSGLKLGMPVLVGSSMLGRITEVKNDYSVVGTLAMRDVSVYCQIKGTSFYGKLSGEAKANEKGKLFCKLTWLPRDADIKPEMVVYTSGFASEEGKQTSGVGLIPKNIKIGKVRSVSHNEKFKEAVIELSADWARFEDVTVLVKKEL
jgi:rod shape-determining protein MreC